MKYGASVATGIPLEELSRSADRVSSYLLLQRDRVDDITVKVDGRPKPLFNDRENLHMRDVQQLLRGFYILQLAVGGYTLLYLLTTRRLQRHGYGRAIGGELRWAGLLTISLFAAFGLLSALDFDALFLQFHLVSFDNDLWQLDPSTDNLIRMFPQGFWYDSAIRLAELTVAQAVAAVVAGTILQRWARASVGAPAAEERSVSAHHEER